MSAIYRLTLPSGAPLDQWLDERRKGIGASDISAICGKSQWATPYSTWADKTGRVDHSDAGEQAHWGTILEPVIAAEWSRRTGIGIRRRGTLARKDADHHRANVDRLTDDGGGLEIKTFGYQMSDEWRGDGIPVHAFLQSQWCMHVTGRSHWHIVGLEQGQYLHTRRVERDNELIADLVTKVDEFWALVVNDTPPPFDGEPPTTTALQSVWSQYDGYRIAEEDELAPLIIDHQETHAAMKEAERAHNLAKQELCNYLGDSEGIGTEKKPYVKWKAPANQPTRRLTVTKAGKELAQCA